MIVRDDPAAGGGWLAIGQASHAWLCGQLALAWGTPELPAPASRDEFWLAAAQHDVGMAEWDRRPRLAAGGRAMAFTGMPRPLHLELWERAPRLLETQSRYAALLVSLHGTTLYTDLIGPGDDDPAVGRYVAGQRAYQAELRERLGADAAAVEADRRLLFCLDAISLALCCGWPARELPAVTGAGGTPVRIRFVPDGADGARLDPWPFGAGALSVAVEGRRMTGTFADEPALHAALDAAPSVRLTWTLRPGAAGASPGAPAG